MHGAHRWPARLVLHDLGGDAGRQKDHNDRRTGAEWHAPAITNAVYLATDKRIRDLPVTVEKLL
jgi:hypothetical protein